MERDPGEGGFFFGQDAKIEKNQTPLSLMSHDFISFHGGRFVFQLLPGFDHQMDIADWPIYLALMSGGLLGLLVGKPKEYLGSFGSCWGHLGYNDVIYRKCFIFI